MEPEEGRVIVLRIEEFPHQLPNCHFVAVGNDNPIASRSTIQINPRMMALGMAVRASIQVYQRDAVTTFTHSDQGVDRAPLESFEARIRNRTSATLDALGVFPQNSASCGCSSMVEQKLPKLIVSSSCSHHRYGFRSQINSSAVGLLPEKWSSMKCPPSAPVAQI